MLLTGTDRSKKMVLGSTARGRIAGLLTALIASSGSARVPPMPVASASEAQQILSRIGMSHERLEATWNVEIGVAPTAAAVGATPQRFVVEMIRHEDELWARATPIPEMPSDAEESRDGTTAREDRDGGDDFKEVLIRADPSGRTIVFRRDRTRGETVLSISSTTLPPWPMSRIADLGQFDGHRGMMPIDSLVSRFAGEKDRDYSSEGSSLRITAPDALDRGAVLRHSIELDSIPVPHFRSIGWSVPVPSPGGSRPVISGSTLSLEEFVDVEGAFLPQRGVERTRVRFPGAPSEEEAVTRYALVSAGRSAIRPSEVVSVEAWLDPGAMIMDERCGALGQIGQDLITIHGVRHRLKRALVPLDFVSGTSLLDLCETTAEFDAAAAGAGSASGSTSDRSEGRGGVSRDTTSLRKLGLWLVVAGGVVWVVAFMAGRRKSVERKSEEGVDESTDRRSRRRGPRVLEFAGGSLLAVGAVIVVATVGGSAGDGTRTVDLGDVLLGLGGRAGVASRELLLARSDAGSVVDVESVSCGCLRIQLSDAGVGSAPGEVRAFVSMDLATVGERHEVAALRREDGSVEAWEFRANGVGDPAPTAMPRVVVVDNPGTAPIVDVTILGSEEQPPAFAFSGVPGSLVIRNAPWRFLANARPEEPGHWHLRFTIDSRADGVELAPSTVELGMTLGGRQAGSILVCRRDS